MSFLKKYSNISILFISSVVYFYVGYFLDRTHFGELTLLWFTVFAGYYFLLKNERISFTNLAGVAIIFRLIFLFATPSLSQDFYRFIWDGRMIFEGLNPYLSLPENFIQQQNYPIAEAEELYAGMGELNGSHYTNYPPLNQLCFLIASLFASKSIFGSIIILRIIIIFADVGILYFGKKLLEKLQIPIKNIFWFILNPFIIIELTGNLHFESVMLFFFVFGMYKLYQQKWIWAALLIGCAVSVKLIPLLFLPLFFKWFQPFIFKENNNKILWKECKAKPKKLVQLVLFYLIIIGINIILFLPFLSAEFIENYSKSVGLWFGKFEFNASFYYIFRAIGYLFRGYNEIAFIGKITPILTILFLLYLTFFKNNNKLNILFTSMLFGLCFYYFTATTVHPWYLATPLILAIFTNYKFPYVWSLVIILSYQAYANTPWQENLGVIALEYSIVFAFLIYEIRKNSLKESNNL